MEITDLGTAESRLKNTKFFERRKLRNKIYMVIVYLVVALFVSLFVSTYLEAQSFIIQQHIIMVQIANGIPQN